MLQRKALIFNASADEYKKGPDDEDDEKRGGIFLLLFFFFLFSFRPRRSFGVIFSFFFGHRFYSIAQYEEEKKKTKTKKGKKEDGPCHNLSVVSAREAGWALLANHPVRTSLAKG